MSRFDHLVKVKMKLGAKSWNNFGNESNTKEIRIVVGAYPQSSCRSDGLDILVKLHYSVE
jgi:hypothetical protein